MQPKSPKGLLLAPTCVHHSGYGLWRCGAGPLWSYNQQEGFQVLGATCWILLASFGAYSPEKVSHGRIKIRLSRSGFKSKNENREQHSAAPGQKQQATACKLRDTRNERERRAARLWWSVTWKRTLFSLLYAKKEVAQGSPQPALHIATYRYNGKNSLCLRVPKKYIQERDDLYGLAQAHAMC